MKRSELFEYIMRIDDPAKDHGKILANLHYTHFYMMDRYKKVFARYNLSSPQSNVLGILGHYFPKPVSLEEIKEMVLEPHSDISRTVVRLAEKGFAKKVTNKENRRKVSIVLTAKGLKIIKKLESEGAFQQFTSGLTRAEAKSFVNTLAKLRGDSAHGV